MIIYSDTNINNTSIFAVRDLLVVFIMRSKIYEIIAITKILTIVIK